jgi:uncharacterized membrane protein
MTALAITFCVAAQLFLVAGQLLFKHGMNEDSPRPARARFRDLALGLAAMTVWFFLWLGLLQNWELSRVFPFEGLDPLLLVLGAWLILKEKLTVETWLGIGLITAGLALVAM